MWVFMCFAVIFFGIQTGATTINCFSSSSDVCTTELSQIPKLPSRDPSFPMTNTTSHWTFCDVYSINTSKWYKSEARMSESCPSMYMCGTKFPIWLNGHNPDPEEGVVSRKSCLRDFDSCCLNSYELTAVNCGEFMAYCFIDLPSSCHQRYCFDNRQTSTTESQQTYAQSTSLTKIHGSTTDSFTVGTDTSPDENTSKTKRTLSTTSATASGHSSRNGINSTQIAIALAVIGVLISVICGLLIVIVRSRRAANKTDETEIDLKYETLNKPSVCENVYHVLPVDTQEKERF